MDNKLILNFESLFTSKLDWQTVFWKFADFTDILLH